MDYLNFDIRIDPDPSRKGWLLVRVTQSPAGEAQVTVQLPLKKQEFSDWLVELRSGILYAQSEQKVQKFGQLLFDTIISGEVRSRYDVSQYETSIRSNTGLRLRLHFSKLDLAALPWEFLYDSRHGDYVCFSRNTPVVRYLDIPQQIPPLAVTPPLRILGMISNPVGTTLLDTEREKEIMEKSLQNLCSKGLVELTWLQGQTWRDLQRAMRDTSWHIFHFIGHGGFNQSIQQGYIQLADDEGLPQRLEAVRLSRLLVDHPSLRLVFLNTCEGGALSEQDIFSSTASNLARRGIPAVIAMQYKISNFAAIEFSRTFYEAISSEISVDTAVAEARKSVSLGVRATLEWGTPVLYMRSSNGNLFKIDPDSLSHKNLPLSKSSKISSKDKIGQNPVNKKSNSSIKESALIKMVSFIQPNRLEFFVGTDEKGQYKRTTLPDAGNILLMGGKGMGKTNQVKSILLQLYAKNDPQQLQIAIFDFSLPRTVSTLFQSTPLPHIKLIVTNYNQAEYNLLQFEQELDKRRSKSNTKNNPVWLVIIEEFMELQKNTNAWRAFNSLALLGTKHNIFLLATTRNFPLPEELLIAFDTQMLFKPDEMDDSNMINLQMERLENIPSTAPILFQRIRRRIYLAEAKCDMCHAKPCEYMIEDYTDFELALAQQTSGLIIAEEFDKRFWENTALEQVTRGPHIHQTREICKNCISIFMDVLIYKGAGKDFLRELSFVTNKIQQAASIILFKQFGNLDPLIAVITTATDVEDIISELRSISVGDADQ